MLFASIHVPDFPVQAALRSEAGDAQDENLSRKSLLPRLSYLKDQVAVLDGPANQMKVIACNEPARRAGIEVGMTKLQAEALPSVTLRKRVLDHEYVAQAALLECAGEFSPRLESTCPGMVIVDLTGTERLSGTRKKIRGKTARGRGRVRVERQRCAGVECRYGDARSFRYRGCDRSQRWRRGSTAWEICRSAYCLKPHGFSILANSRNRKSPISRLSL